MENNTEYKKAYAELYEIIKALDDEDKEKIPESYIEFVKDNMDKEYSFTFDKDKDLSMQNLKVETKALLVKLYEEYIANEDEKEYWKQYDSKCYEIAEEEKRKKYSQDIFNKNKEIESEQEKQEETKEEKELIEYKENWKTKFIKIFKRLFGKEK